MAKKAKVEPRGEPFLTRVTLNRTAIESPDEYPFCLPVVRNLTTLDFHPAVTYIVGENGTGKSTLLEAIAVAAGFNPEGGSKSFRFSTEDTHSALHEYIRLGRGSRRERDGFFLRAESFYNVATEIVKLDAGKAPPPTLREKDLEVGLRVAVTELQRLAEDFVKIDEDLIAALKGVLNPPDLSLGGGSLSAAYGGPLHEKSHGESFLALMQHRFRANGLYILDEPESALSPARQLSILLRIHELVQNGCQFLIATHSPLLMAYPNSKMLMLTENSIQETDWKETEHYTLTKSFLDRPDVFLHHLLGS